MKAQCSLENEDNINTHLITKHALCGSKHADNRHSVHKT